MSSSIITLIIQLMAGAVGGNVAGIAMKQFDLGTVGNSIAGIVGGGIGGHLLGMVLDAGASGGALDIGSIVAQIAGGGVGGGVLIAIIGVIRRMMGGGGAAPA